MLQFLSNLFWFKPCGKFIFVIEELYYLLFILSIIIGCIVIFMWVTNMGLMHQDALIFVNLEVMVVTGLLLLYSTYLQAKLLSEQYDILYKYYSNDYKIYV